MRGDVPAVFKGFELDALHFIAGESGPDLSWGPAM